jgi:hypothetical protein
MFRVEKSANEEEREQVAAAKEMGEDRRRD